MSTVARMDDALGQLRFFSGSATALRPTQRLSVRSFGLGTPAGFEENSNGVRLYRRDPVFKAGTFKDSWGMQNTWETQHLTQMAFNFGMLREAGKLSQVPWRDGHPSIFGGGGDVIGWIEELYAEDDTLYADWLCTEPGAAEKYDRGTYGPRSAEVGFYESNDEAMYWPVFMGVAFVDIPAVEGLFSKEKHMEQLQAFSVLPKSEVERRVILYNGQQSAQAQGGNGGTGDNGGGEGGGAGSTTPAPQQPDPHPVTGNPADEGGEGQHRTPQSAPMTFSINGESTTDYSAVQRHINTLETALSEQAMQAREEFVKGLGSRNIIPAPQVDAFVKHAKGLTSDQYEDFVKLYEGAQAAPLFQPHGGGTPTPTPPEDNNDPLRDDREIVQQHQRAKMPVAKIKETASFKRLAAAGQAPTI